MIKIQTWYRDQFWEWCQKNNILCEYHGTESRGARDPGYDTWYIENEKDRMLTMLRWS